MNRLKLTFATIAAVLLSIAAVASDAVKIQNVGVSHTPDGIQIEIAGNGALQQKALHLTGPERLVIDVPNSIPMNQHTIAVNAPEARDVRVAQFQADPPVTRVVVDLGTNVKYDISSQGNRVVVNLHTGNTTAKAPASQATAQKSQVASNTQPTATAAKQAPKSASTHSTASSAKLVKSAYRQPQGAPSSTPAQTPAPAPTSTPTTETASAKPHDVAAPVSEASSPEAQSAGMQTGDNATKSLNPDQPKDSAQTSAQNTAAQPKDFVIADAKPIQPATEADSATGASAASAASAPSAPAATGPATTTPPVPSTPAATALAPATTAPAPASAPEPKPQTPAAPEEPKKESAGTSATPAMVAANLAREQQQSMQVQHQAPRARYTGAPYSFNLKDADLKDFFRAIAEITGLNIVLDPNVKGTLTLDLHDVPWDQALDIVLENNNLDKQLEGNVLRIATVDTLRQEAEAQLAKAKAQALAVNVTTYTHYLSYAHAKDTIATVKKLLSQRGDVSADDRTNAVIVRDIPSTIPEIQRLLIQLDRKTQQVQIEARVVAATRNFAREIGTQLAFGAGGGTTTTATVGGTGAVGSSPTQIGYTAAPPYVTIPGVTSTAGGAPTFAGIPLFSNLGVISPTAGIGASLVGSNFRLDAVLTLAESRGLLKVLSSPHITTQNNVKAIIQQGVRVPVVTQAQLGGPPTVTYVDAFLKLIVTPQITAEGTIFLDLEVENTTADFSREVQGNPTLDTQGEKTQVLVTNGGTVQVGGVMLTSNTVNISQVPLLGDIPILGNAFKHRSVSTNTQELIFFITPKIVES